MWLVVRVTADASRWVSCVGVMDMEMANGAPGVINGVTRHGEFAECFVYGQFCAIENLGRWGIAVGFVEIGVAPINETV